MKHATLVLAFTVVATISRPLYAGRGISSARAANSASVCAFDSIAQSIGVLTLRNYAKTDTVRILNDDASPWYTFTFYYDDSDGKWDYPNPEFQPRGFHPDYFLLALDVVQVRADTFVVVVNDSTGLRKRMHRSRFLQFLGWPEYILTAFSVEFSPEDNPLRVAPQPTARRLPFAREVHYHPSAVRGDWLKLRWQTNGADQHAWIRWRAGRCLLVRLYPFA